MFQVLGNVHSLESCGSVNGPGVRFVVYMQGCPMRCLYCHKPDTWDFNVNKKMSVDDILVRYDKVKEFLKNGGLTVTGGEPLMQADFISELFKKAKTMNIHTAIETSGVLFNKENTIKIDKLLENTDLVLLDIKHIDPVEHNKLTGHPNNQIFDFARYLSEKKIPVWIRHVVVPTITANKSYLTRLGEFLATLNNIEALDILPYNDMALTSYEAIGKPYPLKGIPSLTKQEALEAKNTIIEAMRNYKIQNR